MPTAPRYVCRSLILLLIVAAQLAAQQRSGPLPPRGEQKYRGLRFAVSFPASRSHAPLDGRLLVLVSADSTDEPRFQINDGPGTQLVFGIDVDSLRPGMQAIVDHRAFGFPLQKIGDTPRGTYRIQAVLNRYQTYHRSDGHTVKLPPDRGEGQQWNRKPGNLYSTPKTVAIDPADDQLIRLTLENVIPPIPDPPTTRFVKHERITSRLLSDFWGTPVTIGAHVLLPAGFDEHPHARYPLVVFHGHFPYTISGFRETPPDTAVSPDSSERFQVEGYNLIEDQYAYQLFKDWTGKGFPRVIVIEIQHPTPFYDDSYAVNSANNGPYGDAIQHELIPYIEKKYRGIGEGWARFVYGGSTGGWETMAAQVFYPDDYNGAWVCCPDPIDFRAYTVVNIYNDRNAYYIDSRWKKTARPGSRDYLGHIGATLEESNHYELALGTQGRSGEQWDIWQAVFSPCADNGYPKPIWDKLTGEIDHSVADYWREHYDLSSILRRDWKTLGPKLRGKLHIYVGEADNFYLNNAVYLVDDFLSNVKDPPADAEIDYEARAEHCWNGDHKRPNAISRLRYHQMFIPRIMDQIRKNHPAGADTTSWRY